MVFACGGAAPAKPGPAVITFMERYEWNSDVRSADPDDPPGAYVKTAYLYSLVSAYRKLTDDYFGNVFYMNKYDLDDGETASNAAGVSVTRNLSGKASAICSYSYTSNPQRNVVSSPESTSDRLSFALKYRFNPKEKAGPRYSFKTTYSTGTDFSFGRTLSFKPAADGGLGGDWTYSVSYQFVWGLTDAPERGIYRTQFANQWELDLNYKIDKTQRLSLNYIYLNNLYHGAVTDNNIVRLSYMKSFQ